MDKSDKFIQDLGFFGNDGELLPEYSSLKERAGLAPERAEPIRPDDVPPNPEEPMTEQEQSWERQAGAYAKGLVSSYDQDGKEWSKYSTLDPYKDDSTIEKSLKHIAVGFDKGVTNLGEDIKLVGKELNESPMKFLGPLPYLWSKAFNGDGKSADEYSNELQAERQMWSETAAGQSVSGMAGELAGYIVPTLPIPGAVGKTVGQKMASAAAFSGGLGATMTPMEDQSRVQNALIGAGFGVAAVGGLSLLSGGFRRIANARMSAGGNLGEDELRTIAERTDPGVIQNSRAAKEAIERGYDMQGNYVADAVSRRMYTDYPEMQRFMDRIDEANARLNRLNLAPKVADDLNETKARTVRSLVDKYGTTRFDPKNNQVDAAWDALSKERNLIKEAQMEASWLARARDEGSLALEKMDPSKLGDIVEDSPMQKAFRDLSQKQAENLFKYNRQSGGIATDLAVKIAGPSVGAAIGWHEGGIEGAVAGAFLGYGAPWAASKLYKSIGRINNSSLDDIFSFARRSQKIVESFGPAGKMAGRAMEAAEDAYTARMGLILDDLNDVLLGHYEKRWGKLVPGKAGEYMDAWFTEAVDPDIGRVLSKTLPEAQAAPETVEAANKIRQMMHRTLDEAASVGIISKDRALTLKAKSATEGFFPRVYNHALLDTEEGVKLLHDSLAKHMPKMTMKEATGLAETMMGHNNKNLKNVIRELTLNKDGTVVLNMRAIRKMLQHRGTHQVEARSVHLEKARKFPAKMQRALEPVLLQDPRLILTEYFNDAYKRIEYAKILGKDDDVIVGLAKRVKDEIGGKEMLFMLQTFYHQVGDGRAKYIQQAMDMNPQVRNAIGRLNAFETLKLLRSAVINMSQATVNGGVWISARQGRGLSNPIRTAQIMLRGYRDFIGETIGSPESMRVGARSGAAVSQTIMQYISEISSNKHLLFGREFQWWDPRNIINDPTTFLKLNGFLKAEQIQRKLAANFGKAYLEDLLEQKSRLIRAVGAVEGEPGKRLIRNLERIDKALEEVGVNPKIIPEAVPDWMMNSAAKKLEVAGHNLLTSGTRATRATTEKATLMAAKKVSDKTNFINDALNTPLWANSPYAKLLTKFKSFAYHQGTFVWENVLKQAIQGNMWPMMVYGTMAYTIGLPVSKIIDWYKGAEPEERHWFDEWFKGLSTIGGLGIWADLLESQTSYGSAAESLAGPGISDILTLAEGAGKSVVQTLDTKQDFDISYQPLLKSMIDTTALPRKKEIKARIDQFGESPAEARKRRLKEYRKRRQPPQSRAGY